MLEKTCQERLEARIRELFTLFFVYRERKDGHTGELWIEDVLIDPEHDIYEYGHTDSFEYIKPNTFQNQQSGFYRWSLEPPLRILRCSGCGSGQSPWDEYIEEFHWFVDDKLQAYRVDYWSSSFYDAERISLNEEETKLLLSIWSECFEGDVVEGVA